MAESSSDEFEEDIYVFYKDREEWKDVTPVPQDDGDDPVVAIAYSEKFRDVYDYFRAVVKTQEKSERALLLTQDALTLNSANYTVWQYRRDILKELKVDLKPELQYVQKMIEAYPKNYQVWHHRRVIVEWLGDPAEELELTAHILQADAKNYHAWQHRQWVIKAFNLFDGELDYVDHLLTEDIRNNSAWNQRYFVINNTTGFTPEALTLEIEYTLAKLHIARENESAWNYLRGLLLHDKGGLSQNVAVTKFCENLYESGEKSPFLLALLVDMCEENCQRTGGEGDGLYTLKRAQDLCHALANTYDTIRSKYWEHVSSNLVNKIQIGENSGS